MILNKLVKCILAILLFACLLVLPYGFYQMVRFVAFFGFAYLAFNAYEQGHKNMIWYYAAMGLLFQPFFKVALGRSLWNIVDILVGTMLLISAFRTSGKNIKEQQ